MAALDFTVASNSRTIVTTTRNLGTGVVKQEALIDFSTATGTPLVTISDTAKVMIIPKGAHVLQVGVLVLVADTGAATFDVQDSAGSSNWITTACNLNTKGNTRLGLPPTDTLPAVGGKLYVADDYLTLAFNGAGAVTTTGKVIVWMVMANIENVEKSY